MAKHRPNPYKGMGIDKLRDVIHSKNYSGMAIKELECADFALAGMLRRRKEGIAPLSVFYDEGLIRRMNRPKNYFTNLSPEKAMEMVREKYKNLTLDELSDKDGSLAGYLGRTRIMHETLIGILIEGGVLVRGSKSHPERSCKGHAKWVTLTAGYKSFREYMPHYVKHYANRIRHSR